MNSSGRTIYRLVLLASLMGAVGCPQGGIGWLEFTPSVDGDSSVRPCGVRGGAIAIADSISAPILAHAADSLDIPEGGSFYVKSFHTGKQEPGDRDTYGDARTLRLASIQEVRPTAPLSCSVWDFIRRAPSTN